MIASVSPGYQATGTAGSITVGTLYTVLDGAVSGLLFGWIYNRIAGGKAAAGASCPGHGHAWKAPDEESSVGQVTQMIRLRYGWLVPIRVRKNPDGGAS
jgi:hypothetical protein